MYNVSQAYINKIMSRSVTTAWIGVITTKSNRVYDITDRNIKLSGSKVASDGVSGDSIQIGTANVKQLTLQLYLEFDGTNYTINGVTVDRYDFYGATVKLTFRLYLNNAMTQYEDVVLPTFIVQDSQRASDLLTLTAFDYMKKLGKVVTIADNGTAYDMAYVACSQCGIELGQTRAQIQAMTNGNITIFPYEAGTYAKTGTAVIQNVGAFICACAYIGSNDKLYFRQYSMTTNRTISSSWRFSSNFADYETHYATMVANDVAERRTITVTVSGDSGLAYDLGTNVFVQYGSEYDKRERVTAIINKLNICTYTPFNVTTPIDPALEVFDVLEFTDNQAVSGKKCCITSIEYNLNGRMTIKGVGDDPNKVESDTKVDTELRELSAQIDSKTIYFYNFTNSAQIEIADGDEEEICNIRFVTTSSASVLFQLEALVEVETTASGINYNDLVAKATYYINELEWENYYPTETWLDGDHMLHLFFPMDILGASAQHLVVTLHCSGGSVIIKPRRIKSSVYGQNLAATDTWDGNITIRQELGIMEVGHPVHGITMIEYYDTLVVATQVPVWAILEQEIGLMNVGHPVNGIDMLEYYDEFEVETNEV